MRMLDTDICIYIIKQKPNSVLKYFQRLQTYELSMSAVTSAELMNGVQKSSRVEDNIAKLNELAELLEIKPFDQRAALVYGDIRSAFGEKGDDYRK